MTLGENGIFTRAVEAKRQQEIADIQEKLELEKANFLVNKKNLEIKELIISENDKYNK